MDIARTLRLCDEQAQQHEAVVVAYSGGKDSLVTLDLCTRTFKRVEAFFMYWVPGLAIDAQQLEFARARWGVTVRQYPHWAMMQELRAGIYTHPSYRYELGAELTPEDVDALALADAHCTLMAVGMKMADGTWRATHLGPDGRRARRVRPYRFYPLANWLKWDVYAYLDMRGIPRPPERVAQGEQDRERTSSVNLTERSLFWLHDHHPDDFLRVQEYFPFVEALIWRRKFYGA
jgi:phosphoadenosine phosphosulfate reductase